MNGVFGQPTQPEKRKVFVSFHHADENYRNDFHTRFEQYFISMAVKLGDIDTENSDEYTKRLIQEDHVVHSSVVVALYGAHTRKRKHVDWEISAGLTDKVGGHKGLIVIILPNFPAVPFNARGEYDQSLLYPYLHPRTAANVKSGYADLYYWPGMYTQLGSTQITDAIEAAAKKRETHDHLIDNSHPQYANNLP